MTPKPHSHTPLLVCKTERAEKGFTEDATLGDLPGDQPTMQRLIGDKGRWEGGGERWKA